MQRKIKFRQKTVGRNDNKAFHYWGFMDNGSFISPLKSSNDTYWTALQNSEQNTGLKDKNGKEIYEGDIIRSDDDNIEIIQWGEGEWIGNRLALNSYLFEDRQAKYFQVIGNIYENPELLK